MRKTTNLLIRQGSKKSSRENPQAITNTSFKSRQSKDNKKPISVEQLEIQKQMVRAENLTQKQQTQIQQQARKTVTKKIKMTQNKIESEIVAMLQSQCTKLGIQVERQKNDNQKLRMEIEKLRKNIQILNQKLQKAFNEQTYLSKNQIDGKIENKQLAEELQNLKNIIKRKQSQIQYLHTQKQISTASSKSQVQQLKALVEKLTTNNKNLRQEKEEIEQQLQQKTKEAQYLRESFEAKKKEWDIQRRELEMQSKANIEKKGEKITKFQVDSQKLQEKLKEQQNMRKKLIQKNKQLEKQLTQQKQQSKQLQEQIVVLKKRVNDLSILKSSNNAIMNQKLAKIAQENQKLKSEIQQVKTGIKSDKTIQKPVLFGSQDFD